MSTVTTDEMTEMLERVKMWPDSLRYELALKILESLRATIASGEVEPPRPVPRGLSPEEWRKLGAGSGPPPSDEEVKAWIHEHRMEKYG